MTTQAEVSSLVGSTNVLVDEAVEAIGTGWAQYKLVLMTGLFLAADATEVSFLSYLTLVLKDEWNMSSENQSLVVSMVFWGQIIGSPVWGWLADKYGRRPSFLIASSMVLCFGLLTAACQNVVQLVTCRAAVGFGVAGLNVPYDVLAESLPRASRGFWLMAIMMFQIVGQLYTVLLAWLVLEKMGWQVFTLLEGLPAFFGALTAFLVLPESAHWLASQSRGEEAAKIINSFAWQNSSDASFTKLRAPASLESGGICDLWKQRGLRCSFLLMVLVWFSFGAAFYGISFMLPHLFSDEGSQESGLSFNFVSIALVNGAQALGLFLGMHVVDATRKRSQIVGYAIAGVSSLGLGFKSLGFNFLTFATSAASCAEQMASCATWVHTAELFPTNVRATAHALLNAVSRIGGALAPYIISEDVAPPVTALILSGVSLCAAFAICGLDETAGRNLDKDVEENDEKKLPLLVS